MPLFLLCESIEFAEDTFIPLFRKIFRVLTLSHGVLSPTDSVLFQSGDVLLSLSLPVLTHFRLDPKELLHSATPFYFFSGTE